MARCSEARSMASATCVPAPAQFVLHLDENEMLTLAGFILGHDTHVGDLMYDTISNALEDAGLPDYAYRPAFLAAKES
jgi:hypothetical protein